VRRMRRPPGVVRVLGEGEPGTDLFPLAASVEHRTSGEATQPEPEVYSVAPGCTPCDQPLPFICALQAFLASALDIPELSDCCLAMQSFIDCLLAIRVESFVACC
jgi:hypothetical protein